MTTSVRNEVWQEPFTFHCDRCDHMWSVLYEVHRYTGIAGQEWLVYCRDGRPVRAPHLGSRCFACGGLRVKIVPTRIEGPSGAPRPSSASANIRKPSDQ